MASRQWPSVEKSSPEDQQILWQANSAGEADVEAACTATRAALPRWARLPVNERMAIIDRFAACLTDEKEQLASLISQETCKPLWETGTEVQASAKRRSRRKLWLERTGFSEVTLPDGKAQLRHKPHGVMAVFGPYNFPGHLPNGHIIPALIAGNTLVFNPSELTPATAEMTAQL